MSSRKKKSKEILTNVTIEAVAAEGNSLAHINGKVLFVPQTIPGDVVDVQLTRIKSSFMEGRISRIVNPSPDRIAPFCDYYGVCGGCKWQPLPYKMQLEFKQQQVFDQLHRIGKLNLPPLSEDNTVFDISKPAFFPILGSEKTTEYRNKLEFTFSDRKWLREGENPDDFFSPVVQLNPDDFEGGIFPHNLRKGYSSINNRSEGFGLGFHIGGAFDKVLDISKCYLQREPSNEIRNFVKQYAIENSLSFFNLREQSGLLRNLMVRTNKNGDVMVVLAATSPAVDEKGVSHIEKLLAAMGDKFPQIKSLNYVINNKYNDTLGDLPVVHFAGDDAIYEEMEGLNFKIGPKSFYQTNSEQAYRLYCVVRDFADIKPTDTVYDLYTGIGTIALFIARRAAKVIGIEYVPEAIEDAWVNARNNGIDNCEFFAGDMKDVLSSDFIAVHGGNPDVVILDPPRAGIHPDVARVILEAAPKRIVYVSCNPATQARDLAILSSQYEIVHVRPVDMFPHTQHLENVVGLKKIEL